MAAEEGVDDGRREDWVKMDPDALCVYLAVCLAVSLCILGRPALARPARLGTRATRGGDMLSL